MSDNPKSTPTPSTSEAPKQGPKSSDPTAAPTPPNSSPAVLTQVRNSYDDTCHNLQNTSSCDQRPSEPYLPIASMFMDRRQVRLDESEKFRLSTKGVKSTMKAGLEAHTMAEPGHGVELRDFAFEK
ncbi:MAG: hypothetical protein MMC23_005200 [Stictis urceolatum]|nr:hypothetical protein [Stictis urceolata]